MAKILRLPPGMSERNDPRAPEYFFAALYEQLKMAASVTADVASIASGAVGTVTLTVPGAIPDVGMTVQVSLPSALNTGLVAWAKITANNTVVIYLYNSTGGAIDPASGVYAVRVMP